MFGSMPGNSQLGSSAKEVVDRSPLATVLGKREEVKLILDFCEFKDILALDFALPSYSSISFLKRSCGKLQIQLAEDLKKAAHFGNIDSDRLAISWSTPAGIAVGSMWEGSMTPLCSASSRGKHKMVLLLIQEGADVNWSDENGTTALACNHKS